MYDIIGDIHGYADELKYLLELLGYSRQAGYYQHPERKVVFLGDFIDRGPKIKETLEIVRPMVENGAALAVMGNHEFNAIAYHTRHPEDPSKFLRPHTEKNVRQHFETISQLSPSEIYDYVEWFKTLPFCLEIPGKFRAVHAAWHAQSIELLSEEQSISTEFLTRAALKEGDLYQAAELVLKGPELRLPKESTFQDKDGHPREDIRIRWWSSGENLTYQGYSFPYSGNIPNELVPAELISGRKDYPEEDIPVFFGHYWLTGVWPHIIARNICCLDYSVAKGGFLTAYRWDEERVLRNDKFVTTRSLCS